MGVEHFVRRFEVFLVNLDPTIGSEIRKTRPAVVISPDEMNAHISTIIIAPMTTKRHSYPTRVTCNFGKKEGQIVLDQIRTVDKKRLVRHLGMIDSNIQKEVIRILIEMFSE
ncbi:MAG: type II toxin-antitoxin system PemK/MazF family toxin [Anaerolineaceae bacterium]|nr:type II toxin-antitoxin system PemK/MazF family toxin [Anaerolineaceae bacterium]